jgi:hypothetical protein
MERRRPDVHYVEECPDAFAFTIFAALLVVLTLASTAGAGCAWVLWWTSGRTTVQVGAVDAFTSREECNSAKAARDPQRREYKEKYPDDFAYFTCLPDTIDPRGPKGK